MRYHNASVREEKVCLADYHDYHDAYQQVGRFLDDVYANKRFHVSLGYSTPAEFEAQRLTDQTVLAGIPQ